MRASEHRPTWIEVDLDAIGHTLEQITELLPERTAVFAVVKANAYGHGAVAVASYLEDRVAGFCVSNLDEALELREAGIACPILVLGVVPVAHLALARSHSLSLTITSLEWLEQLRQSGESVSGLSVHLKMDTGMGRVGFREDEDIQQALVEVTALGLQLEGVYTHFATADEENPRQFEEQLGRFREILSLFPSLPRWVHASNSAAAIWHQDAAFTMVRLGNALYGMNPSGRALALPYPIRPAMRLTTEIVHVKTVPPSTAIGYGASYCSGEEEVIATLPIGYADGLSRRLQGFSVLVAGVPCPIVGRVSMDQTTIRLPQTYPLGTPVTLIGTDGELCLSVQDWAEYLSTIDYEVVCGLSDRIPRRYKGSHPS